MRGGQASWDQEVRTSGVFSETPSVPATGGSRVHGPGRAPCPTDDIGAIGALQRAGTREFFFLSFGASDQKQT